MAVGKRHARILKSIWRDTDWKSLTVDAQWLYELMLSQESISYAGVLPLTIRRWASFASDATEERIASGLSILDDKEFVLADRETEEALVRTFIRNDGLWSEPRMMRVALRESLEVQSHILRNALAEELAKLVLQISDDALAADVSKTVNALMGSPDEGLGRASPGPGPSPTEGLAGSSGVSNTPTPSPTPSPDSKLRTPRKRGVAASRGTALPAEWGPSEPLTRQMRGECPGVDQELEQRKFVDHWISQPGAKGRKINWDATYRNWIRRAASDYRKNGRPTSDVSAEQIMEMGKILMNEKEGP